MDPSVDTMIEVLPIVLVKGSFAPSQTSLRMTTIGKRYLERHEQDEAPRLIDARTKTILRAVASEEPGRALNAWLRALSKAKLLLLSMGFSTMAVGQQLELRGVVTDGHGMPMPFVNVTVPGTSVGTVTDPQGRFILDDLHPGEVRLAVSSIGFDTWTGTAEVGTSNKPVYIRLQERVVDLPAFTVQSSLTGGSGPARETPGSAWYIGPREIASYGHTDIGRLLRSVPGVNIQEEDGFGLRPNIGMRGAGAERSSKITVMEDGILVAPAPYAAPAAYYFPTPGRMNAIEVSKGSSQIRFGPLTTGGAINLISTPIPDRTTGMVRIWGGSFGIRNLHAYAGTEQQLPNGDRVGFLMETFQQAADGFKRLDNNGPTGFQKGDHVVKAMWRSRDAARVRQAISLRASLNDEVSDETYLGLTMEDFQSTPLRRYAASAMDRMTVRQDLLTARYAVELPTGTRLVATAYRTNTHRDWYKLDQIVDSSGTKLPIAALLNDPSPWPWAYGVLGGAGSGNDALQVKSNLRNYQSSGLQFTVAQDLTTGESTHALEAGLRLHGDLMDRYQRNDGYRMEGGHMLLTSRGQQGTESNRVARADAIAAHFTHAFERGRLGVRPGVRYEHITMSQDDYGRHDPGRTGRELVRNENTVEVWIPGIAVDLTLREGMIVFAGVHRGFSPPGSDPGTRPESSVNYESGLRLRYKGTQFQLIGFQNDYSELLGADMAAAGGAGTGDLFNAGEALVRGVELHVEHDALSGRSERLRLPMQLAWTLTDARFSNNFNSGFNGWGQVLDGDRIPYIARHQVNARAGIEGARAGISVQATHVSDMPTGRLGGTDAESVLVPAYTVVDLAAFWRPASGQARDQVEVFVNVRNLINERYIASLVPAGARPGLPRAMLGGARFHF